MSNARVRFLERLAILSGASGDSSARDLASTALNAAHNSRAALVRNGLAVVAFAILEEFVKSRVAEAAVAVVSGGISFSALPKKLQDAATARSIKAIQFQADMVRRGGADPTPLIQEHAGFVAGTAGHPFEISGFAFGYEKSNLNDEDVKEFLSAFLVKDGWAKVESLASRAGIGSLSLKEAFRSAAARRHHAAHHGDASVPQTDLEGFARIALAIAIGFDALLGRAARLIAEQDQQVLGGKREVDAADIRIRFVEPVGSQFREVLEGRKRAVRRHVDVGAALAAAKVNARPTFDLVVVRDRSRTPSDWISTDASLSEC